MRLAVRQVGKAQDQQTPPVDLQTEEIRVEARAVVSGPAGKAVQVVAATCSRC